MNQLAVFTDTIVDDDVVIHEEEVFAPYSTGELHVTVDEPLILQPGCVLLPPTQTLLDSTRRPLPLWQPVQEPTFLYAARGTALPLTVRYAARRR
jgi:hypothetical protein